MIGGGLFDALFLEIAVVIVTAGVLSLITSSLRQPLIVAYILTGIVVGPSLLYIAQSSELFTALSEIGIAFLLFIVGLNLNWTNIKDVGIPAVFGGLGQVVFTSVVGYAVAIALGFPHMESIFLGVAFAFSSTIIIVKMLTDKEDLDRFYGRISVGMLIVQDIIAMIILLVMGSLSTSSGNTLIEALGISLAKGGIVIVVLAIISHYVVPHLFRYAARSQELLFLTALTWCFAIAATLQLLGFSLEIGALLAGIMLANHSWHREIEAKVRPLRDFFLIIFFIVLGTHLDIAGIGDMLIPAIIFSLLVFVGNPLIVIGIFRLFGYQPRTGFLVGSSVAQISEFSFILLAAAISIGFVAPELLPLATIVGLITITASTYLIQYAEPIYDKIAWIFRPLEIPLKKEERQLRKEQAKVVLLGHRDMGRAILPTIEALNKSYLIVDFDPHMVDNLGRQEKPVLYADAGSEDTLKYIRAEKAEVIISTIPDPAIHEDLMHYLKQFKKRPTVIVTAKTIAEAEHLYTLGVHFVIVPSYMGGEHFSQILSKKKLAKRSWTTLAKKQKDIFSQL